MSVRCECVYVFVCVVVMERGFVGWVGGYEGVWGGRKLVLSIFNQPFQHIYGRQ